jgi:hypothetical protein
MKDNTNGLIYQEIKSQVLSKIIKYVNPQYNVRNEFNFEFDLIAPEVDQQFQDRSWRRFD